jgi:Mycothiol maleylpyruvate isomerase N-terminal domain
MDESHRELLTRARPALQTAAGRTIEVLRSLPDGGAGVRIPGSDWTVREAAVHLITGATLAGDIATGMRSPVTAIDRAALAADNAQRIADIPESNPEILAGLLDEAVRRLLQLTGGRRGDEIVVWHGGRRIPLAQLVCVSLGEQLLHGADMATATGRPWAVEPDHARLVATAYAALDAGEFQLASLQGRTSWTWL